MELPAIDRANLEFGMRVKGQVLGRVPGAQFFMLPFGDGHLIGSQVYEFGVWGRGWSWRAATWGENCRYSLLMVLVFSAGRKLRGRLGKVEEKV